MKVCYFGPYDPEAPRNRVVIKGLVRNGVKVIECNAQSSNRLSNYLKLLRKHLMLNYDIVMLGARGDHYGQPLVPLVKRMTRKPVVFDSYVTMYETDVVDRKIIDDKSVKAKLWYLLDRKAFDNSSLILSDTSIHARYYSHFYEIDPGKFRRVLVGSDDEIFYPRQAQRRDNRFLVLFWGGYIPLQGVQHIIGAAKLLENHKDIEFELRGSGQTYNEALELSKKLKVKNISFVSKWIPYNELPSQIARADVCLGIFGETEKAKRVIPNKAVETLAMKKPLITGDSRAAREILINKENSLLIPMMDPQAIADAVLMLKEDEKSRNRIAENGYRLFRDKLTPKSIGKELTSFLMELI